MKNRCTNGKECTFSHPGDCYQLKANKCSYGKACQFRHLTAGSAHAASESEPDVEPKGRRAKSRQRKAAKEAEAIAASEVPAKTKKPKAK